VTLSDGDVAALARQAVDLVDPAVAIRIEPASGDDPYRRGRGRWTVWPLVDGHRSFGVSVDSSSAPADALARLVTALGEHSGALGGPAGFPPCPGHTHPAAVSVAGGDMVLTCPETGAEVGRLRPVVS
jgi:hypothetical protein